MWSDFFQGFKSGFASGRSMALARKALDLINVNYEVVSDKQLVAKFPLDGGHLMSIHMIAVPNMIDVMVRSGIVYDADCVPQALTTGLLELNQKLLFGAFRLFRVDDDFHIVCGAVVDPAIMDGAYVARVVKELLTVTYKFVGAVRS